MFGWNGSVVGLNGRGELPKCVYDSRVEGSFKNYFCHANYLDERTSPLGSPVSSRDRLLDRGTRFRNAWINDSILARFSLLVGAFKPIQIGYTERFLSSESRGSSVPIFIPRSRVPRFSVPPRDGAWTNGRCFSSARNEIRAPFVEDLVASPDVDPGRVIRVHRCSGCS